MHGDGVCALCCGVCGGGEMNSGSAKRAWANDGPGAVWPCAQACESVDEIVGEPNWDEGIEMSKLNRDELTARHRPDEHPTRRSLPDPAQFTSTLLERASSWTGAHAGWVHRLVFDDSARSSVDLHAVRTAGHARRLAGYVPAHGGARLGVPQPRRDDVIQTPRDQGRQ